MNRRIMLQGLMGMALTPFTGAAKDIPKVPMHASVWREDVVEVRLAVRPEWIPFIEDAFAEYETIKPKGAPTFRLVPQRSGFCCDYPKKRGMVYICSYNGVREPRAIWQGWATSKQHVISKSRVELSNDALDDLFNAPEDPQFLHRIQSGMRQMVQWIAVETDMRTGPIFDTMLMNWAYRKYDRSKKRGKRNHGHKK